jgi:hypothetical protein
LTTQSDNRSLIDARESHKHCLNPTIIGIVES